MNILYVSTVCSKKTVFNIFSNSDIKIAQSIQKFNQLLLEGFVTEKIKVTALSSIPIDLSVIKDLNIKRKETDKGIQYIYTEKSLNNYCNAIITFLSSFYQTFIWGVRNKKEDAVIICDVLIVSVCMGALFASKILGIKIIGIVTDIPDLMVGGNRNSYSKLASSVNKKYINNFDLYILLTEQMNELVNLRKKPYMIMEGLVDSSMKEVESKEKDNPKNIIYAGGIYKRYGVKTLIDAFMMIEDDSIQLSIYGHGDLQDYIKKCSLEDNRVKYFGIVPNNEVVEAQLSATLLVNPRPSNEEFTKYSFPSKNMEYMVSGTPVLTTKLPGMPKEYDDFVYLFEEESLTGYFKKIKEVLSLHSDELKEKGESSKIFVLKEKNNVVQAKRILNFINDNLSK